MGQRNFRSQKFHQIIAGKGHIPSHRSVLDKHSKSSKNRTLQKSQKHRISAWGEFKNTMAGLGAPFK